MYAPKLYEPTRERTTIREFRGINHNLVLNENEFYDTENMSSEHYPVLSVRPQRGIVKTIENCNGLSCGNCIAYVSGNTLYVNGENALELEETGEERKLIPFGSYLLILPDGVYYNTTNKEDHGTWKEKIEADCSINFCDENGTRIRLKYIQSEDGWRFGSGITQKELWNSDGTEVFAIAILGGYLQFPDRVTSVEIDDANRFFFSQDGTLVKCTAKGAAKLSVQFWDGGRWIVNVSIISPNDANDGEYMANFGERSMKLYRRQDNKWNEIEPYIRIGFQDDDNSTQIIKYIRQNRAFHLDLSSYNHDWIPFAYFDFESAIAPKVYDEEGKYVVIPGGLYDMEDPELCIAKFDFSWPIMDFVVENGNRLWGCRYGENRSGKHVNEIYASALGDFRCWYIFDHTKEDSYVSSMGGIGEFTGLISYRGHPMFFKNDSCYTVYGSYPENFQIVEDTSSGVAPGAGKSLTIINNILYYFSVNGFMRYDGTSHEKISDPLGVYTDDLANVKGGELKDKYYVVSDSRRDGELILVYDTKKNIWHREKGARIKYLASYRATNIIFCDANDQLCVIEGYDGALLGDNITMESPISWSCETGPIGYYTHEAKYIGKIQLHLTLPEGSSLTLYVEYDSDGYQEMVGSIEGTSNRSFTLPFLPRRCDHFKLIMKGVGDCKLFSLSKVLEEGGEL